VVTSVHVPLTSDAPAPFCLQTFADELVLPLIELMAIVGFDSKLHFGYPEVVRLQGPPRMNNRVPPESLLMDGSTTTKQFIEFGAGFVHEILVKRCGLQRDECVLDLGCGLGQKARVLADYLNDAGRYEGIDIVPQAVEFCQYAYLDKPFFRFQAADIRSSHYNPIGQYSAADYRFPYEDETFDLVFLSSIFTRLLAAEVANYCGEIRRVLKPTGRCAVTCFLLNEETRAAIAHGWTGSKYKFQFVTSASYYLDANDPAKGVAHDESWMRRTFTNAKMRICEIAYGRWSGSFDLLQSDHDIIIAVCERAIT
jgi:SAM-dependent methyltransferase